MDVAMATLNLGLIAMSLGDLPRAQELLEDTLAMNQATGGTLGVAIAQSCLGEAVLTRGDHAGARGLFQDAFRYFAELEDWANAARTLEGVAGAIVNRWPDRSTRLLGVAAAMRERVMRPRNRTETSSYEHTMGVARLLLGEGEFASSWEVGRSLSWDQVRVEMQSLATMDAEVRTAPRPEPENVHGLSPRELEVLQLLAEGRSNRAIAEALSISERTVENHVMHILTKLDLESRTAAATWAVRHGFA